MKIVYFSLTLVSPFFLTIVPNTGEAGKLRSSVVSEEKFMSSAVNDEVDSSVKDDACTEDSSPLVLTDQNGWFNSPNYRQNYPNNAYCQWLIVSLKPEWIIRLDFIDIKMEAGYDSLTIYDGNKTSAPPIAMFDGVQWDPAPTNVRSSGPSMLVVMTTDYSITDVGFNVTYSMTAPELQRDPCYSLSRPVLLNDYNNTFYSPGYSTAGKYWNYADCSWLIESQEVGGTVQLWFDTFATEENYDVAWIYDGPSTHGQLIGIVHGTSVVTRTYRSTTQYMYIHFVSDYLYIDVGFKASYRSLPAGTQLTTTAVAPVPGPCGSILHVSPGYVIISPGYDLMCHLSVADTEHLDTKCVDLVQQLPGIGNATSLVTSGGNFGCLLSTSNDFTGTQNSCYDNYQWSAKLSQCYNCPYLFVCIRLPPKQVDKTLR